MREYGQDWDSLPPQTLGGSTDIGNVSYVLPTMHFLFGISAQVKCFPLDVRFAAVARTKEALKQAVTTRKGLAFVGWIVCLMMDSLLMSRATLSRRSPRLRLPERKRIDIWRNINSGSACQSSENGLFCQSRSLLISNDMSSLLNISFNTR
ncbi:hypothetical protein BDV33DRAFT_4545 [Aspergillus novoparasiticus]|uniref:Uncharacterized protein n=1 Tax=Aspergillus novoparasiticus TaxID=986946 RepID=A0A5N6F3P8_9EURO|nr:hypothetical protein BDV33DRAFT_4545 [Aspergillus novoparasiticus]